MCLLDKEPWKKKLLTNEGEQLEQVVFRSKTEAVAEETENDAVATGLDSKKSGIKRIVGIKKQDRIKILETWEFSEIAIPPDNLLLS